MALRFPADLAAWQHWHQRQHPLRRFVHRLRGTGQATPEYKIGRRGGPTRLLIGLESGSASSLLALITPLDFLHDRGIAVVAPASVDDRLLPPDLEWSPCDLDLDTLLPDGGVVVSTGHYLPIGAALHAQASSTTRFVTVQHGLLTPLAPPLASRTTLLAWSQADAEFWRSQRRDVEAVVVGSQLLWRAGTAPSTAVDEAARPIFLGQLHGAELPRLTLARAAWEFCRAHQATYRPHPAERDIISRTVHQAMGITGIEVSRDNPPLAALGRPVVSVFSTGVLEAAAGGAPAWVYCQRPPRWLAEFWDRYGMRRWGGEPTPAPPPPPSEPARAIADWLHQFAD